MKKFLFSIALTSILNLAFTQNVIWEIGKDNNSGDEFALYPNNYNNFIDNDFGWEDKFYLIGKSKENTDWPYILPGTSDAWGGTSPTAGRRSAKLNVFFAIDNEPETLGWKLTIDLLDVNSKDLPLFKVLINGENWKYRIPAFNRNKKESKTIKKKNEYKIEIDLPEGLIRKGSNEISLTILDGSWLKFDQIKLEGPEGNELKEIGNAYLRSVSPANYEFDLGQPLLVDVEHLSKTPSLQVKLDGSVIFNQRIEMGRYIFEAPMPAVSENTESNYEVLIDGKSVEKGIVKRMPKEQITPAGYVNTKMGTAHSRWMIAPGPWMPFSMVKLSPDNQPYGWQSGYDPTFESIGTFSHIHEWTMSGLGTFPANGELKTKVGSPTKPDKGYRSRINKETEDASLGHYKVELTDYDIKAELTSTTRCGFQRYTFPDNSKDSRVMIDLFIQAEYPYLLKDAYFKKIDDYTIEGYSMQKSPYTWGLITQEYTVYFVIQFDQPINDMKIWKWTGTKNKEQIRKKQEWDFGAIAYFDTKENPVVQMRSAISYVSIENAKENLKVEIADPHGWSFESVKNANLAAWNNILNRVEVSSDDYQEKMRFYSNMYRSIASRNIFSDVNGEWVDAYENVQKLENPDYPALGCDAFWNSFWNLNQLWNLVTPEWTSRWVNSQLEMYNTNGWLAKGPAGIMYMPVMVAEHEIPLIVGAYQMGIRDFDKELAFDAVKKMQTTPGQKVGKGFAGNRDLEPYLEYKFIPYNKGRYSNTMEYSYDDWTVSQFARALNKEEDYKTFLERGYYWKNAIDTTIGYARLKNHKGEWMEDFDEYKSGKNKEYVEGNAWQLTFFVPQDVPALANYIGEQKFIDRLTWGFEESYKTRFNGKNDYYWDYPVVQGNQQSMHFAYLFNHVGQPWQTQKWSRAIMERYYGYGIANAYLGDEDQGQMSAWFVMSALGLFQTDGGCAVEPMYEIGSPLFEKVEIDLGGRYGRGNKFVIEAINASKLNMYIQSATLNGKPLNSFKFPASELLKGGKLELEMGSEPNKTWGVN